MVRKQTKETFSGTIRNLLEHILKSMYRLLIIRIIGNHTTHVYVDYGDTVDGLTLVRQLCSIVIVVLSLRRLIILNVILVGFMVWCQQYGTK